MKSLNTYVTEKFQVPKDYKEQYAYTPKDKKELIECIKEKVKKEGYGTKDNPLDLNDIDTSKITDMSNLFDAGEGKLIKLSKTGYFDISEWDVSNVKNMYAMFYCSGFNGDISEWDVSNVEDMNWMFAKSNFNGDISNWDVNNVIYMGFIFMSNPLRKNPPEWYSVNS